MAFTNLSPQHIADLVEYEFERGVAAGACNLHVYALEQLDQAETALQLAERWERRGDPAQATRYLARAIQCETGANCAFANP